MAFLPLPQLPSSPRPTKTPAIPAMKSKKRRRVKHTTPNNKSATPAPRIDLQTSTLSLRQQLNLARSAHTSEPTRPIVRTKFRRKKATSSRDVTAADADIPDGKYVIAVDPLLYIDGYNVIGHWPRLRKFRDRGDMESARRVLTADVTEFACVRGWDCVLVYDAQGCDTAEKREDEGKVEVVYTGSETADTFIERGVYETCELGIRQVWAVTSDVAQLSFSRAKGAHIMSSKLFVSEMKRIKRETREKVAEIDGEAVRGNMLISNVDQVTRDRLYKMRDGKL